MEIYDFAYKYADEFIKSIEFKRFLELKKKISEELEKKIISFKTAESKYLEAKKYGIHHPNLVEYKQKYTETKISLYSEPLVKEYKMLENKLQEKLNEDINDLKKIVSNKFKLNFF